MRGPYLLELKKKEELLSAFQSIGCDPAGAGIMLGKARIYPLLVKDVKSPAANALKQHMLSCGGEAVVPSWVIDNAKPLGDVLLLGTPQEYRRLCESLSRQPWGLKQLGARLAEIIPGLGSSSRITWEWSDGKRLELGSGTRVMGILNITPDSFSDGGQYLEPLQAVERAMVMVEQGADLIDVGGESTRPNSKPVSAEEELERLMPILTRLVKELPVPISLDTYKAEVAREGLRIGIHILNDEGGGLRDAEMARVVADYQCPVIAMHNPVVNSGDTYPYEDVLSEVTDSLAASQQIYCRAGLAKSKIAVDPGIGFGKNVAENLQLIKQITALKTLGSPVLLAVSRKGFIGRVLDTQVNDRLEGSLAVAAWAALQDVELLRVHDVKETVRLLKMLAAIREAGKQI